MLSWRQDSAHWARSLRPIPLVAAAAAAGPIGTSSSGGGGVFRAVPRAFRDPEDDASSVDAGMMLRGVIRCRRRRSHQWERCSLRAAALARTKYIGSSWRLSSDRDADYLRSSTTLGLLDSSRDWWWLLLQLLLILSSMSMQKFTSSLCDSSAKSSELS